MGLSALPAAEQGNSQQPQTVSPDHVRQMASGLDVFKKSVGPLLTEHCVKCHGGEKTKGELDLTTRESLLKGGADGPAIVVGKSRESRLIKLISHAEEPHMPSKAPKLADGAIAQVAAWIDAGAPYAAPLVAKTEGKTRDIVTDADRKFWSFQPLRQDKPSGVKDRSWSHNPIDRFIFAGLSNKKLKPNPPLEKRKLIRRAYFDLIGLPPTPSPIDEFLNDARPDAFRRLVDALLASPQYGERWGRHWLDLARFAESHGYEQDYDRTNAYHYRDFVIQALNMDLPYDTFVKWQLAGDELAPDTLLAMKATGFLAAGTHATQITANQAEKERYDELDDIANTIGTSMLGMTIGCARCHDHKFDPIPTRDYYRMISTFTTTVRSDYDVLIDPPAFRKKKERFDKEHAPLVVALEKFEREQLDGRLAEWEKTAEHQPLPHWLVLDEAAPSSKGKATFTKQADGSFLVSGENPEFDTFTFTASLPIDGVTAVRLDALSDKSFPKRGPGRADNGNFALSDFSISVTETGATNTRGVKLSAAKATFEQKGLPVAAAIDGDKKSAWAVDPQFGTNHSAIFELTAPLTNAADAKLTFTLRFENNARHAIGRPRLSITTNSSPSFDGTSGSIIVVEINRILEMAAAERSAEQKAALLKWYRSRDLEWRKLNDALLAHARLEPKPDKIKVLISSEGVPAVRLHTQGPDFYEKTYFLKRGDLNQKQEEAAPGFLQVLMRAPAAEKQWLIDPPKGQGTTFKRRALANWLCDVDSGAGPLLARVIVNRLWQHHFGRGLVSTPSDFGVQGEKPTHPELLDWLAGELIRNHWQLKPMHKLIMSSATYQQDDTINEKAERIDPDNRLLGRRTPQRVEAEIIRDAILAVSGRLETTQFGPGSLDEEMRRRSIYFTIKRSKLIPMMVQFDGPDSLQGLGRRPQTTIAPQALLLLNNSQVRAAAFDFAKRLQTAAQNSLTDAVRFAYQTALGRAPQAEELADTIKFIEGQMSAYRSEGKKDERSLALADFCQALFGLNEFAYVD